MAKVGTKDILGREVEVHATASGLFELRYGDQSLAVGSTLDAAVAKARAEIQKSRAKIEVKFITHEGGEGVATGIHARNRTILARIDGKAEALPTYHKSLRPDTPPEKVARLREINAQVKELTREARAIERDYEFNLGQTVRDALNEAAGEGS